jgi:predicted lipoprotein
MAKNVIHPRAKAFLDEAKAFETQLQANCATPTSAARELSKEAWIRLMKKFHQGFATPVGPLIEKAKFLHDQMYSWPLQSSCGTDLEVVRLAQTGTPNNQVLYTMKGLGTLEYLLFEDTLQTTCNPSSIRSKPAVDWTLKPAEQKQADRCAYARFLAKDLVQHAAQLEAAWDPKNGNPLNQIPAPVIALSDALFNVETLKDERLGKALGAHKDCLNPIGYCLERSEHERSGLALTAIIEQVETFEALFLGGDGMGFDDYLKSKGRENLATEILQAARNIRQSAEKLRAKGTLQDQIKISCQKVTAESPTFEVCDLHQQVRSLTLVLKSDFLVALSLRAPPVFEGDND